jgi:hypothetical protein
VSVRADAQTRRTSGWHRVSGRLVVASGFVVALTALWLSEIGVGEALFGDSELTNALMQSCGWVINLAIAERTIRRPARRAVTARAQVAMA